MTDSIIHPTAENSKVIQPDESYVFQLVNGETGERAEVIQATPRQLAGALRAREKYAAEQDVVPSPVYVHFLFSTSDYLASRDIPIQQFFMTTPVFAASTFISIFGELSDAELAEIKQEVNDHE